MNPYFALYQAERAVRRWLKKGPLLTKPRPTVAQTQHLEDLAERLGKKTAGSRIRYSHGRHTLADQRSSNLLDGGIRSDSPRHLSHPIVANRAKGASVWDVDGNRYLDCMMGFGVHLCGHNPPFLLDSIQDIAASGAPIGPLCSHAQEVGERVVRLTGAERVAFCNTGSEAVMYALRLARVGTGRKKVVVFSPSCHGNCAEALHSLPWPYGGPLKAGRDLVVMDYNTPQTLAWLDRFGSDIAAVLIEPVRSRSIGEDTCAFLQELRRITARHGTALIFDEVTLGFRLALGGAQEWFGIRADLVAYGKILGGGLPIGAVAGAKELIDAIDVAGYRGIMFRGTFNRNTFSMVAARGVLRHLEEQGPQLQQLLNAASDRLVSRLQSQLEADGISLSVTNLGSLLNLHPPSATPLLRLHLLERGVHCPSDGRLFLSTAHGESELEELFQTLVTSAREMHSAGFL